MILCEFCDEPMKQMGNGDYSCVKCGKGRLPALPNGIGVDLGRGESFTPPLSHVDVSRCELCGKFTSYIADNGWCWDCIDEMQTDGDYCGTWEE